MFRSLATIRRVGCKGPREVSRRIALALCALFVATACGGTTAAPTGTAISCRSRARRPTAIRLAWPSTPRCRRGRRRSCSPGWAPPDRPRRVARRHRTCNVRVRQPSSWRQRIRHPFTVKVRFLELAQKFNGSGVARFWITPGGGGSDGLSVDLGVDRSVDQVEIALRQRNV